MTFYPVNPVLDCCIDQPRKGGEVRFKALPGF